MKRISLRISFFCLLVFIVTVITSSVCFANKGNSCAKLNSKKISTISCIILHQPIDGDVIIKKMDFQSGEYITLGKFIYSKNQTFIYKGEFLEPNFYILDLFGKYSLDLILFPEKNIVINIDLFRPKEFKVKGYEDSENLYKIDLQYKKDKEELINPVIKKLLKAQKEKNNEKIVRLTKYYYSQNEVMKNRLKSQMKYFSTPVVIYSALKYFNLDDDIVFLDSLASKISFNNSKLGLVNYFVHQVNDAKKVTIGAIINDIALPNKSGDIISTNNFKGKYVLVDFWASWNKQSRNSNQELKLVYNKYNLKGFEIFSISLDENKQKWIEAIEGDKSNWTQVSDLKGFNSYPAKQFNVTKVPFNFLLDKEGRIVAKNIRGENLDQKLSLLLR